MIEMPRSVEVGICANDLKCIEVDSRSDDGTVVCQGCEKREKEFVVVVVGAQISQARGEAVQIGVEHIGLISSPIFSQQREMAWPSRWMASRSQNCGKLQRWTCMAPHFGTIAICSTHSRRRTVRT